VPTAGGQRAPSGKPGTAVYEYRTLLTAVSGLVASQAIDGDAGGKRCNEMAMLIWAGRYLVFRIFIQCRYYQ